MKRKTVFTTLVVASMLLSGCATVKVYSDAGLKNETGIRCYTLKPYLLVEYNAEEDDRIKTTVVYLPDISSPQYMVLKPGVGSSELKMSFASGALETYGVVTDSKLPEAMEAFAAMLSKTAYAAQTMTSPSPSRDEPEVASDVPFRLYEIVSTPSGTVLREVVQ